MSTKKETHLSFLRQCTERVGVRVAFQGVAFWTSYMVTVPPTWIAVLGVKKLKSADLS